MKNIKTVFSKLFAAALAGAFLAGCTNTFDVSQGASGDAAQPAGYVKVLLGNVDSRTIFPNEWTEAAKGALKYYISGEGILSDATGSTKTLALTPLDYAKITGDGQQFELSPGTWTLTLSAYQLSASVTDPAPSNMVLTATNPGVDLTASGSTETFALKPVTTTQATGTVSITGTVNCGSYLKYIVQDIGRYSGNTFTSAENGAYKDDPPIDVSASTASGNTLTFSYSKPVVAASDYYYVVDFYNGKPGEGGESLGHYEESLIVSGGNTSSKTINLGNYLNSPAENPATLTVDTSYTNVGLAGNGPVPNTFVAKFKWDDNSGNETGYELKIYKGIDSGGTTTYELAATINKTSINIGTAAGNVVAGSSAAGTDPTFGKNETQASVCLETGYTYKASIRAYNRYDEGDASDIPTTVTQVNNKTTTDGEYGMFTVAYTLGDSNAYVKTGDGAADKDVSEKYVVGYNYNTEAQELMGYVASTATSTSYPYVTVGSATMKWKKWITTVAGMTSGEMDDKPAVTNIPAGNIENMTLTGVWMSVATVSVVFPSFADLAASVWMTSYSINGGAATAISSNDTVAIDATAGDVIVFTYDETKVSDVSAFVPGAAAISDPAAHTVTFNTSSIGDAEGFWHLTIKGTATVGANGNNITTAQVSQQFNINLK